MRNQKGERPIYPVISSLRFLYSLEYPKRVTELCRKETGEGGDRGDFGQKNESQKGREKLSQ